MCHLLVRDQVIKDQQIYKIEGKYCMLRNRDLLVRISGCRLNNYQTQNMIRMEGWTQKPMVFIGVLVLL